MPREPKKVYRFLAGWDNVTGACYVRLLEMCSSATCYFMLAERRVRVGYLDDLMPVTVDPLSAALQETFGA